MAINVSLFAGFVLVVCAANGMSPLGLSLAVVGFVGLITILWRRHGRIVFTRDAVTLYNAGLAQTLRRDEVEGYVWRAPQNFMPYGDGIVFVAECATNGIGLRTLAPMATASRLLSPRQETVLVGLIDDWHPGIVYYKTPTKWRSRSPLIRKRTGGVDPPPIPPVRHRSR